MDNPIKVCILTTSMQRYENDNRSPFILELAKAIKKNDIDVSIVTMHVPGSKTKDQIHNIPIRRLKYYIQNYETLQETRAGIPAAWRKSKLSIFLIFFFLIRLTVHLVIHGCKFDVIHANWTISSLGAVLAKPFHKRRIVTTLHGSDVDLIKYFPIFKFPTKFALNVSDAIICVSTALKKEVIDLGIKSEKIFIIPNGIDPEHFSTKLINNKKNEILFVGSLTRNKGAHLLLEVFRLIKNDYPNFTLRIIGDGPEEKRLAQTSKELEINDNVIIQKSIPHNEIGKVMQEAFMFVLPSVNEGFGVVLLEALASGLPCIAFDSGGVKDILGDGRGILVKSGDVSALSLAIINLIKD